MQAQSDESTLLPAVRASFLIVLAGTFVPYFEWLIYPGALIAVPMFPRGPSNSDALPYDIALWGGAFLVWSAIIYLAMKLKRRVFSH
jgi:hypothetical protein